MIVKPRLILCAFWYRDAKGIQMEGRYHTTTIIQRSYFSFRELSFFSRQPSSFRLRVRLSDTADTDLCEMEDEKGNGNMEGDGKRMLHCYTHISTPQYILAFPRPSHVTPSAAFYTGLTIPREQQPLPSAQGRHPWSWSWLSSFHPSQTRHSS